MVDDELGSPGGARALRPARARRPGRVRLLVAALVLLALIAGLRLWASVWTAQLWYHAVGYDSVWRTQYLTRAILLLTGGALTGGLMWASMWLAFRRRPVILPGSGHDAMERYRQAVEPFRRLSFVVVPLFFALLGGTAADSKWRTALLWVNRQSFGRSDAHFHKDIGFYVFTLPWIQFVISFLTMAAVLSLLVGAVTHYVYGGIRVARQGDHFTPFARVHLCTLAALIVLLRGANYWYSRYQMTSTDTSLFTGVDYTTDHATLPMRAILASAAVLCALLFLATIYTRTWRLPLVGLASMLVCAVALGAVYQALVQALKVRPSMQKLQASYIADNIAATRAGYGLGDVTVKSYAAQSDTDPARLRASAASVPGIRLVDPYLVSSTFQQMQGKVNYFRFGDVLDVDRYRVQGKETDTVIGVRELDTGKIPAGQRNWVNLHTVYTHGYGLVAAYGNRRSDDGEPVYLEQDLPPKGQLGRYEPRIYFGELSPNYSIVGSPRGGQPIELDYPDNGATGEQRSTYDGGGGVAIGSPVRRLAYALKFGEYNFLGSDAINADSRLLDVRSPRERVAKAAPWLTLDGDTYPIVAGGRVLWVVDGYTTSAAYPGSQLTSLGASTADSVTKGANNVESIRSGDVNYIRNSVKATVDAFDGSVKLYAWDETDPVLKAWRGAFGGTVLPRSAMPASVMSHVRYPEDLFKVQRDLLARYHVTDPAAFFTGGDFWRVPDDPTTEVRGAQPPYYLSVSPDSDTPPRYALTTTYIPIGTGQNLSAFMSVDSDAGSQAGKVRDGYGRITILRVNSGSPVRGPAQFHSDLTSSAVTSKSFEGMTLKQFLSTNGSSVDFGNALTLPFADGLLYVEPIYVRGATGYPLQRAVVVEFGKELAWGKTLGDALDGLFGTTGGAGSGAGGSAPSAGRAPSGSVAQAIEDAQQAYDDGQAAIKRGDWKAYGEAQDRLQKALNAAAAGGAKPTGSASPKPSANPSSAASSSPSASAKTSPTAVTPTPSSTGGG